MDSRLLRAYHIHMIGIGGAGMCALARVLHQMGYAVSGSDNNESDNIARLEKEGITVVMGHCSQHVGDADLVIYSAAIMPDNPELLAARAKGIDTMTRAEALGVLSNLFEHVVAISGTHGKTTATSMLCSILCAAQRNFSAIVGGYLPCLKGNGRLGGMDLMVCEACEFADTYLQLKRDTAVILNIDHDHLEYFKTEQRLIASFRTFAQKAQTVIVCGDDDKAMQAVEGMKVITFGFGEQNEFTARNITMNNGRCAFDLYHDDIVLMRIQLNIFGKHNVYNAMAAAVCAVREGIDPSIIREALQRFSGAGRRFEIVSTLENITIADDYAHHPAEIKAVLDAARQAGYDRIIAVFQPFTYSRTSMLMDDFAQVLSEADEVVLTEIMGSREVNTYGVSSEQLQEKIPGAYLCRDFQDTAQTALSLAGPGDLILTLGCGDIYKAARKMAKILYHA